MSRIPRTRPSLILALFALGSFGIVACTAESSSTKTSENDAGSAGIDAGSGSDAEGDAAPLPRCLGVAQGCVRPQASTELRCEDNRPNGKSWTTSVTLTPADTEGFCRVRRSDAETDIEVHAYSPDGERDDALYLRLRKFTGPGTYTLVDEADIGAANTGLTLRGKGSAAGPNDTYTARAGACGKGCVAVVKSSTTGVPAAGDYAEYSVEVDCADGLYDYGEECTSGIKCTLSDEKLRVDIGCTF